MRKASYKPMSKKQLAAMFGISLPTLRHWIRLARVPGYNPSQRILRSRQVAYIMEHWDGELDDQSRNYELKTKKIRQL